MDAPQTTQGDHPSMSTLATASVERAEPTAGQRDRRLSSEEWDGKAATEYICPRCLKHFEGGQFWIQCDVCKEWFHGSCVFVREHESHEIERFHCIECERDNGLSKMMSVTNDHRHDRTEENPEGKPLQAGTPAFLESLKRKNFAQVPPDMMSVLRGQQLTFAHLVKKGFTHPILVEEKDGLDISVPDASMFSIQDVVDIIGPNTVLDVIDSRRQISVKLTAEDFCRLATRATEHDSIYNCISLEVSRTKLGDAIKPPSVVNKLSWVDRYWPKDVDDRPRVSKYCLMSMADSYTDFHIDFGGTSVWYHILKGSKVFYVIPPTDDNLKAYEEWMALKNQSEVFFPEKVKEVFQLDLRAGNTLLIPTGWIHAVWTPTDSIVFGGNFLHSLDIQLQNKIRSMEKRLKTPDKFQFPYYEITHWYAAPHILKLMQDNLCDPVSQKHLVDGVAALIEELKVWADSTPIDMKVPLGYPTRKIIKDLSKCLKKANKKIALNMAIIKREQEVQTMIHETSSDSEKGLAIDESSIDGVHSRKDSEVQRPLKIRMKLSLCGKGGLPEVTEATLAEDPTPKKRKVEVDDPEILNMIKDRPEDDDYIYLDVESASDDEDILGSATPDHSWCPSAKVVIRGTPKEARPTREHAKREVIESCIASAAARLEQAAENRKKNKLLHRRLSRPSRSRTPSQEDPTTTSRASPTTQVVQVPVKPKKGEKTPKQRLAKLMGIRRV